MAGKPSKGCNTCRRRKKGCDLQRPICGQCQKLKPPLAQQCAYRQGVPWVNLTPDSVVGSKRPNRGTAATITLAEPLARSAYQERYLGLFWDFYLPNGRSFPVESAQFNTGFWMNELHRLFHRREETAIRRILLAISLSSVGRRDQKPWMVENGIKLYGSCLNTLAEQIKQNIPQVDSNALATSRLLSVYELLHGHDQRDRLVQVVNWKLHIDGELGFILSRGPESFTTGFAHQMFVDGRTWTYISTSIPIRTPSPLNSPEWRTIPWKFVPKTAKDLLGDIFAEVPGLLAQLDELIASHPGPDKETKRFELVQKCSWLLNDWTAWGQEKAPETSPLAPATAQAATVFNHFIAAHIMSGYFAIGIYLHAVLAAASNTRGPPTPFDPMDPVRFFCRKIAEMVPTFLHPHVGIYGTHGAVFPSIVALTYLEEIDGNLSSLEASAFYEVFSIHPQGTLVKNFVENMRQRLSGLGKRMFPSDYPSLITEVELR